MAAPLAGCLRKPVRSEDEKGNDEDDNDLRGSDAAHSRRVYRRVGPLPAADLPISLVGPLGLGPDLDHGGAELGQIPQGDVEAMGLVVRPADGPADGEGRDGDDWEEQVDGEHQVGIRSARRVSGGPGWTERII